MTCHDHVALGAGVLPALPGRGAPADPAISHRPPFSPPRFFGIPKTVLCSQQPVSNQDMSSCTSPLACAQPKVSSLQEPHDQSTPSLTSPASITEQEQPSVQGRKNKNMISWPLSTQVTKELLEDLRKCSSRLKPQHGCEFKGIGNVMKVRPLQPHPPAALRFHLAMFTLALAPRLRRPIEAVLSQCSLLEVFRSSSVGTICA